jgi:hypothetical protein
MTGRRTVEQVCEDQLDHPELLKGCNLFVQQVCAEFGYGELYTKGDNADRMIGRFRSKPFVYLGTDEDKATKFADDGYLVLGGLTLAQMLSGLPKDATQKPTMGHIVVIAPGGPCEQKEYTLADGKKQPAAAGYPYCYGGAAIARYRIKEKATISLVMPKMSRDETQYAYLEIPKK